MNDYGRWRRTSSLRRGRRVVKVGVAGVARAREAAAIADDPIVARVYARLGDRLEDELRRAALVRGMRLQALEAAP